MKKNLNSVNVEGRLYECKLEEKTVSKAGENFGKPFLRGSISIATDENGLNIVPIHFNYVAPVTKAGKENQTFTTLKTLMTTGKTIVEDSFENATKVKASPSLAVNDFYIVENQNMVSDQRLEGGFVNIVDHIAKEEERNAFHVDTLITNVREVEENVEKNIEHHVELNGYVFNFKNDILPVRFVVKNEKGMDYFTKNVMPSPAAPYFVKIWGKMNHIPKKIDVVEESAWGDSYVSTVERRVKEWVVVGVSPHPYEFGNEKVITMDDVQKCIANRNIHLEEVKNGAIEYSNEKKSGTPNGGFSTGTATSGGDAFLKNVAAGNTPVNGLNGWPL